MDLSLKESSIKLCNLCGALRESCSFYDGNSICKLCESISSKIEYQDLKKNKRCSRCKINEVNGRALCDLCHDETTDLRRKREQDRRDKSLCQRCSNPCDYSVRETCDGCSIKLNSYSTTKDAIKKEMLFDLMGHECKCCGEMLTSLLSIDHINSDGGNRREKGEPKAGALYRRLLKTQDFEGLQLLCLGCNQGKYLNGGICPHNDTAKNYKVFTVRSSSTDRSIYYEEVEFLPKGYCSLCKIKKNPANTIICGDCIPSREERASFLAWHNRVTVLEHYGPMCKCCEEANPRLLSIDHINNDARNERNAGLNLRSYKTYAWLIKNNFPEDRFQILCLTCNNGKHINKGVCPHQTTVCYNG